MFDLYINLIKCCITLHGGKNKLHESGRLKKGGHIVAVYRLKYSFLFQTAFL